MVRHDARRLHRCSRSLGLKVDEQRRLALEEVSFSYPSRNGQPALLVLDHVWLALMPGQLVVVAGRSGSGKSTLLQVAAGLLLPSSGHVLWRNEPIEQLSEAERTRRRRGFLGFVFQNAGLLPALTAAENVALPGVGTNRRRDSRLRSLAALERVGLAQRSNHFPAQLSGGEQQRVGIARALFADPEIIVVDEPTSNLDRRSADAIIDLLGSLASDGRAVLAASHDVAMIDAASARINLESPAVTVTSGAGDGTRSG